MVQVTCPLDVLKQREVKRNNRRIGTAEASFTYLFPKDGYDITVSTCEMSVEMCARRIVAAYSKWCI